MKFSKDILRVDPEAESVRISSFIREMTVTRFKRRGVVVGLSGGVDSAVVAGLCVRALPKERVLALLLPEKESDPLSLEYAKKQAQKMGVSKRSQSTSRDTWHRSASTIRETP